MNSNDDCKPPLPYDPSFTEKFVYWRLSIPTYDGRLLSSPCRVFWLFCLFVLFCAHPSHRLQYRGGCPPTVCCRWDNIALLVMFIPYPRGGLAARTCPFVSLGELIVVCFILSDFSFGKLYQQSRLGFHWVGETKEEQKHTANEQFIESLFAHSVAVDSATSSLEFISRVFLKIG